MTLGLGIDTSFDDTAVALVEDGNRILANLTVSQFAEHENFGGVIPERASRLHVQHLFPLLERALARAERRLEDLDYVAVTNRPGLIGSLLVGVSAGKALAMARGLPLVGVNHLEAHVYAVQMEHEDLVFPFVSLLVSGANTVIYHHRDHGDYRVLGGTLDDAVGECLDKSGRFIGLPLPAGPHLQKLALAGDAARCPMPRPMLNRPGYDFSFSGLKTAVVNTVRANPDLRPEDLAAGLLEAASDVLARKTFRAARDVGVKQVALCGGVAANLQLREAFARRAEKTGITFRHPSIPLCTDNAAMVAGLGYEHFRRGELADLDLAVAATVSWKRD
ncbi:MAG: tRNA (adenosine(37)-N6)-threonylcarbamoyltransferase complex transferase subunit TsaD [Planctomycetota bacterium]